MNQQNKTLGLSSDERNAAGIDMVLHNTDLLARFVNADLLVHFVSADFLNRSVNTQLLNRFVNADFLNRSVILSC